MKLHSGAFGRVKSGAKTLELRLFDEKRQTIRLDDEIEFIELPGRINTIRAQVVGLLNYPTFASIVDELPTSFMGYLEADRAYLRTSMYEVYTPEDELRYGVLGIKFAPPKEA